MSEFSRLFALDALRDRTVHQRISADNERAALAERFGILAIGRLDAELSIRRVRGGRAVRVEGSLTGDVTQACVVSLAPVEQKVAAEFATIYVPVEDLKPLPVDEDGEVDLSIRRPISKRRCPKVRSISASWSRRNWPWRSIPIRVRRARPSRRNGARGASRPPTCRPDLPPT